MRRTRAIAIATLALLAVGAGAARDAHAIAACTAADIILNDGAVGRCPSGTGPCNIGKVFQIGDGCTLDFGTRAVTILASGKLDILSNSVSIRAGSFTIVPSGVVEGRGTATTPPRDKGGLLTITTTGAVDIQKAPTTTVRGSIDVSGNARCGTVTINAGGPITVSGDILTNNLTTSAGNGIISLRSGGDVTSGPASRIEAAGGTLTAGGYIEILAVGKADLGTSLVASGGDGGVVDISTGGEAIVRGMGAQANGDAGSGGCASVFAGTRVQMLGAAILNGTGSSTGSGGGCGGFIDVEARYGDVTISADMKGESGGPDGGGGGIGVLARGNIVTGAGTVMSVQGIGTMSCGGEISLESELDVTANSELNASGGFGGNLIDILAGRHVTLYGVVDAQARYAGGFGGSITISGGDRGQGNVTVNNRVDVRGGSCDDLTGCGIGGFTEISGCDITVGSAGNVLAGGPDGGDNLLQAHEQLRVQGTVDAATTSAMTPGVNTFQHPSRLPLQNTGVVNPPATVQALATCTTVGQANCLVPCPACGNGMVEFPETCDQSGNTVNCDGCSSTCRTQNCNDSNACTADTCDATLGCDNQPANEGASCSDGNVCNGVEACTGGLCRSNTPPLNCNDNNVCTTDSCSPTLGCQNPPAGAGTTCSDNNACTVNDTCNATGTCQPGGPRVCTDGNACTQDNCNPATGCVFPAVANGTGCEDGAYCTINDTCQSGSCASGGPRDCSDTDSCTTDACDENNNICTHNPSGACCGDGTVNGTEQCDDGNSSNADACLNTCVNATCGDGFVRTGVEQCDAGAANSNAPNATCRLNCLPRRCGDGIVDTQTEQCDDGGTASGDGCSATCGAEPPATAQKIPGRGSKSLDCGLEWAYDRPAVDLNGIPMVKQTCRDGDPACDQGTTPGECTLYVWVCANNTDARLPLCTPGAAGMGNVATVETLKPSTREAGLRPVDNANRQQLLPAAAAAQTSTQNSCGPRVTVRVPLKSPDTKGLKVLKLRGTTDKALKDTDVLKLFCTP
jgi:cysteine-rich repeat protein